MHTGDSGDDSSPVAQIDLGALRANASALIANPAAEVVDLRADAWGHGTGAVSGVLASVGVRRFLVDDRDAAMIPSGTRAVGRVASVDSTALFGLPGGARMLTPVMTLLGSVLSVKSLLAGEGVSYGYLHRAPAHTRVALVTGGYAQGIVRALGGRADTRVHGEACPIVGRVAMDVCVVDVGTLPAARGDVVVFFGDTARGAPSLGAWTRSTGLSASEITSVVGVRARRICR